jgi:hypothetical protein
LQSPLGGAKRPEESIGEIFSPISRRNQKLQCFEVDDRLWENFKLKFLFGQAVVDWCLSQKESSISMC